MNYIFFCKGAPFMDDAFFPYDLKVSRDKWTEGDRYSFISLEGMAAAV